MNEFSTKKKSILTIDVVKIDWQMLHLALVLFPLSHNLCTFRLNKKGFGKESIDVGIRIVKWSHFVMGDIRARINFIIHPQTNP